MLKSTSWLLLVRLLTIVVNLEKKLRKICSSTPEREVTPSRAKITEKNLVIFGSSRTQKSRDFLPSTFFTSFLALYSRGNISTTEDISDSNKLPRGLGVLEVNIQSGVKVTKTSGFFFLEVNNYTFNVNLGLTVCFILIIIKNTTFLKLH